MKRSALSAITAAALFAVPAIASAQGPIDVSGGYMSSSQSTSAGAAAVTLHGAGVALPTMRPQITLLAPLTNGGGRYALTTEGSLHIPMSHAYVGAGIGVGRLNTPLQTGALYDAFAGARVAPHVDLVGRYYSGLNHFVGQGLFAGLSVRT